MSAANGNGAASVVNNEDAWKRVYAVGFADWVNEEGKEARREHMDRLVRKWKMSGEFPEVLGGESSIAGPSFILARSGQLSLVSTWHVS